MSSTSPEPHFTSSELCQSTMNCESSCLNSLNKGRGRWHPPTTFDDSMIISLFDYVLPLHIWCQLLASEAAETNHGQPMLCTLPNLLARHIKEMEKEKSRETKYITELSAYHNHISSSLKRFSRDTKIEFPLNLPSPSSPTPSHLNSPPLKWCSPSIIVPPIGRPSPYRALPSPTIDAHHSYPLGLGPMVVTFWKKF